MAIFRRDVFPKGLRTGKTPLRGKISPRCMQNQLILARSASYVCLKPGKRSWGIHLTNILPGRASFPVRSSQIMHNEQLLPLFCGSAFCAGAHRQRCGSGRIEALWSPFTWRCKREPAWRRAGKVRAAPLAWRRKRCGSSSAVASIMRLIRRRRRRVAHPQVRASGAHPGLQVL